MKWFGDLGLDFSGSRVLEVGSYDVNGSVRSIVERGEPALYVGIDQEDGPGVDRVLNIADMVKVFGCDAFDYVISTEVLEHAPRWADCIAAMVEVLKPGGTLIITTRSVGFPYHPYPVDVWRYSVEGIGKALKAAGMVDVHVISDPEAPGVFVVASKEPAWVAPWGESEWTPDTVMANDGITPMVP
jgi:SAM-dependent methyltransferase